MRWSGSSPFARAERREANLAVYRDQLQDPKAELAKGRLTEEQIKAGKLEVERRAAEDALLHEDAAPAPVSSRWLGVGLAAVVPVAAFGLCFWPGNPAVLTAIASGKPAVATGAATTAEDITGMITQIEARTRSHPTEVAAREVMAMRNEAERLAQGGAPAAGGPVAAAVPSTAGDDPGTGTGAGAGAGTGAPAGSVSGSVAMVPGNVLSNHKAVTVVARISSSGNPIAQPGDLEGRITGVAVGSTGVKRVIDCVLP